MKKLIFIPVAILLMSLQSCIISHHPNMAFFDNPHYDYKEAKFTSINVPMWIAKPFIKNALRREEGGKELIALIKKISDVRVMTIESGEQQMLSDFTKYLTANNFEEWMTVKKDNETVNFQAKQNGDVIKKLLITVKSGKELVYVDVSGKFTPGDISRIINYSEKNDVRKMISN